MALASHVELVFMAFLLFIRSNEGIRVESDSVPLLIPDPDPGKNVKKFTPEKRYQHDICLFLCLSEGLKICRSSV